MAHDILTKLAARVGKALKTRKLMLVTVESCTGGGVGEAVTRVPGSSDWFERGFITYTYISKREMLGVKSLTLERHGAVSEQAAREMAQGALKMSHAQVAVAVSGTAGPSGGTRDKPVGTVCLAWARKNGEIASETRNFKGNRQAVRRQSVEHALKGVLALLAR
ncbi:MAG: CinA family protein [Burkholderiales bacterium]